MDYNSANCIWNHYIELKGSQLGTKAINMDFKIITHANVTYRPKEVRQVRCILTRFANFSIKRKINSPQSYIQLSVTSNRSSTQQDKKSKTKWQNIHSCTWPVPLEWAFTGEAKAYQSSIHTCSPCFLPSLYHRLDFIVIIFLYSCRLLGKTYFCSCSPFYFSQYQFCAHYYGITCFPSSPTLLHLYPWMQ